VAVYGGTITDADGALRHDFVTLANGNAHLCPFIEVVKKTISVMF
jgi:hypothetical protein